MFKKRRKEMGRFFCKQNTAYEMRISDGSSDVCSSDLLGLVGAIAGQVACVEPCLMHALGAEMMLGREPRRIVEADDRQIHIITALVEREAQRRPARRAEWALGERR